MKKSVKSSNTKIVIGIIIVLIIAGILYSKNNKQIDLVPVVKKQAIAEIPISISKQDLKGENFSGTKIIILGSSPIAAASSQYIEDTIASFKASADSEVPEMRAKFGSDSPTAKYTIDFDGKVIKSNQTETIVISQYVYTGGANGMNSYKTFTSSITSNKIINLSSIIKSDKQESFLVYVKKALNAWRPDNSEVSVVFPEDVSTLVFADLTNWSLGDKNLTLYFDKYQIGPGALGAVAFPLSISKIESFLSNK